MKFLFLPSFLSRVRDTKCTRWVLLKTTSKYWIYTSIFTALLQLWKGEENNATATWAAHSILSSIQFVSFCSKSLQHMNSKWFLYLFSLVLWGTQNHITLHIIQGDQDHFLPKEMLISLSILKLNKNPWIWEGLRTIHFI